MSQPTETVAVQEPTDASKSEVGSPANGAAESLVPRYENYTIRDDTPVESIFAEKQYRLLVGPLYASWKPPGDVPFLALANVGLFYKEDEPPLVPDAMLALNVRVKGDPALNENNSYFIWKFGKPPDVVVELVSDRRAKEDSIKLRHYERIGVPYYVVFDPNKHLGPDVLRSYIRVGETYEPCPSNRFPKFGVGVTLWEAPFEDHPATWWLRWCDLEGNMIPTGEERAEQEHQRAEQAHLRAEQLAAKLRALGVDPDAP